MDTETYFTVVSYFLCALTGLCVGSFLNVVIYRVPNGMSIAKPASHCPTCNTPIKWYDNIPVVSYILLGGKCRSCKTHIPFRYTAVELSNAILWIICMCRFLKTNIPYMLISMAVCSIFICIFFIDLEHMLILDRFQIMLAVLAVLAVFSEKSPISFADIDWLSHIIGLAAGFGVLAALSALCSKITGREALGGGDIKLCAVMGLLLGWQKLLLAMLIASVSACVVILFSRISKRQDERQKEFPFAPFLTIGFAVAMIFGDIIINSYISLITGI